MCCGGARSVRDPAEYWVIGVILGNSYLREVLIFHGALVATPLVQGPRGCRTPLSLGPCVPSVGPTAQLLFMVYVHVPRTTVLPASTATFCFVCSTCDAAMDLLPAHATRLAPEQARLALELATA